MKIDAGKDLILEVESDNIIRIIVPWIKNDSGGMEIMQLRLSPESNEMEIICWKPHPQNNFHFKIKGHNSRL